MSDIADKLIDTAYSVDGMLIQRDNLLRPIPTLMRDAAIDIRDLETENAKLRELVRNLLRVIPRDVSGVVVGAHSEHPTYYSFDDAMRELGVEVDDA